MRASKSEAQILGPGHGRDIIRIVDTILVLISVTSCQSENAEDAMICWESCTGKDCHN